MFVHLLEGVRAKVYGNIWAFPSWSQDNHYTSSHHIQEGEGMGGERRNSSCNWGCKGFLNDLQLASA